jgi:branched-chain amino acid aminotransferase
MPMSQKSGFIWFDGKWVKWNEANIHILTHSLHYGMGIFEGLRAYQGTQGTAIFRLQDHTDRFFRSAYIMNMPMPFDKDTLNQAQKEVIVRNGLKSAYIRPICFYGSEGMGLRADNLKSHVAIAAWEWGAYLGADGLTKGIRVRTSSYTRHHVNIMMTKAKVTGNYVNSMLALQEAIACGVDEALLLDPEGYVAEGSGENFFLIRNNEISTPQLTSCLEGITRATIITFARDLGLKVTERSITRDEVYVADECFFTGTAAEVTPIREVDGRKIGNGERGPLTEKLQSLYFDHVYARNMNYPNWLTHVEA